MDHEEIQLHNKLVQPNLSVDNGLLKKTCKWFIKLYNQNEGKKIYRQDIFAEVLAKRLIKAIRRTRTCSLSTVGFIFSSPLAPYIKISFRQKATLIRKVVMSGIKSQKFVVV